METAVQALRKASIFSRLSENMLARVAGATSRCIYAPGETITFEGDPCQAVYFVTEGQVRIYRISPEGREQVLKRLGPGRAFNLVPVLDGGPNPSSAMAWTRVTVYAIGRDSFLQMMHECPSLADAILADLAGKLRHMTALVEDLSLRTVGARLAKLLLVQAAEKEKAPRRITQQEMAAQLGTVREVVGRALAELEREGLIRMDRHRIVIIGRAGLEARATL